MMKKTIIAASLFFSVIGVSAQQSDTLGVHLPDASELHFLQSQDFSLVGGSYMRVVLDRKLEAGKWTLLRLPCWLDGYYFGADAERYRVEFYDLTTNPVTLILDTIPNREDFSAFKTYLVKSKADIDQIVVMEPGVSTRVAYSANQPLMCLTLDDFTDASGIKNVLAEDKNYKVYDIAGRLAKSVRHGIYIVNGKKIFEK